MRPYGMGFLFDATEKKNMQKILTSTIPQILTKKNQVFHSCLKYTGQLPQIFPLLLAVTNEVAIVTGVNVVVDAD